MVLHHLPAEHDTGPVRYSAPLAPTQGLLDVLAAALRGASALLDRLAQRLAVAADEAREASDPTLEFYAEAGAPEGALYANGQLVGIIEGVKRL